MPRLGAAPAGHVHEPGFPHPSTHTLSYLCAMIVPVQYIIVLHDAIASVCVTLKVKEKDVPSFIVSCSLIFVKQLL